MSTIEKITREEEIVVSKHPIRDACIGITASLALAFGALVGFSYLISGSQVTQGQPQKEEKIGIVTSGFIEELKDLYKIIGVTEAVCPEESPHYNPALCNEKRIELADQLKKSENLRYFANQHINQ